MAKMHTFFDQFSTGSIDTGKWDPFDSVSIDSGRLKFTMTSGSPSSGGSLTSLVGYDITSSSAFIEIVDAGQGTTPKADVDFFFLDAVSSAHYFNIFLSGGTLNAGFGSPSIPYAYIASVAFNAVNHRWWRIREASGTLFFETSANGSSWNSLASIAHGVSPTNMLVTLYADDDSATTNNTVLMDNFNAISTPRTLTGLSRILKMIIQTITGVSRITAVATKTQAGVSRIQTTVAQTITGVGKILIPTQRTIEGLSRITITTAQTIAGKARMQVRSLQTITGVAFIKVPFHKEKPAIRDIRLSASGGVRGDTQTKPNVSNRYGPQRV